MNEKRIVCQLGIAMDGTRIDALVEAKNVMDFMYEAAMWRQRFTLAPPRKGSCEMFE
jgi:hypothetical protein